MTQKMNTKNLMASLVTIMSLMFLVSAVSAAGYTIDLVTVDGISASGGTVSLVAGETVEVKVWFTADANDTDVNLEVELEGEKVETKAVTEVFDVEEGKAYRKVLVLKVPYELKDQLSDSATINVELDGRDNKESVEYPFNIQRPSYNVDIKSVTVDNNVKAGATIPVDLVIKNVGYNDLDDVYVRVSIPALGVEKSSYFGDLVAIEKCEDDCDEDETDTVSGRLYVTIPHKTVSGTYALDVEIVNDDLTSNKVVQMMVSNAFPNNVIVTASNKAAAVGETVEYELLVVNPTNELAVFRVVPESSADLTSMISSSVIAVTAGSSKTVTVSAEAKEEGTYNFDVSVISADNTVETVTLSLKAEGNESVDAVTVLTIVLAIIFVVLLVVLIVLIGKKPEKSEEFGESYY
jgi:hypothetical protein